MSLNELAAKYGTDKLEHGYIPFYQKHLPKEPKRILEIGVKEGASVRMWADFFPNAEIFGLDLFSDGVGSKWKLENEFDKNENLRERVKLFMGHQCDYFLLEELRKYNFDVIIDDGSHNARDQIMTFFGLFNGKHYFIEDLHCNFDDPYSQGLPELFRAVNIFSDIKRGNKSISFEGMPINFQDDKIVCICS